MSKALKVATLIQFLSWVNPISHYGFAPLHHCSLGVPRQFHSPRRRFACGRTSHWHAAQRGRTTATPHQNSAHIPNSARAIFALNIMRPVRLSFGSLPLPLSISMALLDRPLFNLVSVSSSSSSSFDRWAEPNGWTHSDGRRCMQHARLIPSYPIRPSVPSGGRLRSFGVRVVCKGLDKKWPYVW